MFKKIGYKSDGKIVETVDEYGYGSFADTNDSLKDIVGKLKGNLKLCHVIIWGEENKTRQENRIGLVTGSGMDFIQEAMDKDINIFITGDINHHDAMDAMEQGMTLIDISHEGSEAFFVDFVEEIFENDDRLSGIKTYKYYNELKYLRRIV
ncbi:hypothetical protein CKO19_16855 [Rhodovulum adriaticum]|nr:hypothetical protein [Rhodovulum adriaticum]